MVLLAKTSKGRLCEGSSKGQWAKHSQYKLELGLSLEERGVVGLDDFYRLMNSGSFGAWSLTLEYHGNDLYRYGNDLKQLKKSNRKTSCCAFF